ncbi:hypothetical protein FJU08_10585 [Martelella alba]|uniref:Uncharacterized protein n=1 Tax=Martelella alba TaxID=2590451 RepID=A0A506UAZ3_9HYPH|nr:hypothetical protein [Martelella alba]TPW31090.1 hypothetical protein FJU08_10585 [Martelella alba]
MAEIPWASFTPSQPEMSGQTYSKRIVERKGQINVKAVSFLLIPTQENDGDTHFHVADVAACPDLAMFDGAVKPHRAVLRLQA